MRTNEQNRERFKRNRRLQLTNGEKKQLRMEAWQRIGARSSKLQLALKKYKEAINGKRERYEFPLYAVSSE